MWRGSAALMLWPGGSLHACGQEEEGIRAQEVEGGAMEDGVGEIAGQSAEEPEDKGEWGKIKARPG